MWEQVSGEIRARRLTAPLGTVQPADMPDRIVLPCPVCRAGLFLSGKEGGRRGAQE